MNGVDLAVYNQQEGGRRCYNCRGVSGCEDPSATVLPKCSTAVCDYCENLEAVLSFDTLEYMIVQNVSIAIRGTTRSPRSFRFYYSLDSIEGPYSPFSSDPFVIDELIEGRYNFSASNGGTVVGRYWRIEILSNFGDPEHVELVEFQLYGRQLSLNQLDHTYKWVAPESECSAAPVSTSTLVFGFASERSVNDGEFILRVDGVDVGTFNVTVEPSVLRDRLRAASFVTTVSKVPLVEGDKYGQEFRINFYSDVVVDILTRAQSMMTGLNPFPSDVVMPMTFVDPNSLSGYCVGTRRAAVITTVAAVPGGNEMALCEDRVKGENRATVFGVNRVEPTYGPNGGNVTMHFEGNFDSSMTVTMVDSSVSSSVDCVDAVSLLEDSDIVLEDAVEVAIRASSVMPNARFCVRYSDDLVALVPSAYFDVQEASVQAVTTTNCNLALLGESTITLQGSGLRVDDEIVFGTGNCEDMGSIRGRGVVVSASEGLYEVTMDFTSVGDGHLIASFSGMCMTFSSVIVHVYDLRTTSSHLISNFDTTLTILGQEFRSQDWIEFRSGNDTLDVSRLDSSVIQNDRIIFNIRVNSAVDEREYTLYYQAYRDYDSCPEPFRLDGVFTFHHVSEVTMRVGDRVIPFITTVLNKETEITLRGLSFNANDTAYYVNENGDRAVITFVETSATQMVGRLTFTVEGHYYLVYQFVNGTVDVPYESLAMDVSAITAIAVGREPSKEQLVVKDMLTLVEYFGNGIHDVDRESAYYNLTPNPEITGGNGLDGLKYTNNRAVASHGPYVTVDSSRNPMDAVFAFENGGRSTQLNHWIIYDLKNVTTLHEFGMFVNNVFFQQLPRDFQLQRLLSCYDDSCLFDENGARAEAPWETVLNVTDLERDNTSEGQFHNYTLPRDVTARYFRLLITKNWGNTVFTSVIQVNFVGANAVADDMNRAQWAGQAEACDVDQYWSVSARGHSTINTFTKSNRTVLCYDFSGPDSIVEPIRLEDVRINIAEVVISSIWSGNKEVASNVLAPFDMETVHGRTGDKIKFALPGSRQDSDCWTASSEAFGSVVDTQRITLRFDARSYRGSFIVKTNNTYFGTLDESVAVKQEKTVPIYIEDTDQEASIKMEQLTGVDKASVTIEHTSNNAITITIRVLEPSLPQPDFELILPGDEECQQCDVLSSCSGEKFIYDPVQSTLRTPQNRPDCSMSSFLLNREYTVATSDNVYTFVPVSFIDTKTLIVLPVSSISAELEMIASEVKTCPASNVCTAFGSTLLSSSIVHDVVGHAAVGVMRAVGNDRMETEMRFMYNQAYSNLNAPLCYKFGDLPWKIYSDVRIDLLSVLDVQPRQFIAGEAREVVITGTVDSIRMGDKVRVLRSGTDCINGDLAVFDVDGREEVELEVGENGQLTMNFRISLPESASLTLCYRFRDNPDFMHYPGITFSVMNLVDMTASSPMMAADLIVTGQSKSFTLHGNSLSENDILFFVRSTETECDINARVNELITSKTLESQNRLSFFVEFLESVPDALKLCYHFSNYEDENKYVMIDYLPLYVVEITGVSPDYGFVNTPASLITYTGQYPSPYAYSDRAVWTLLTDSSVRIEVDVSHASGVSSSNVEFSTNGRYYLTYQFGNEMPKEYRDITIYGLELKGVENPTSVVGCLYRPAMSIDYFRYVDSTDVTDSLSFKRVGGSCANADDLLPIMNPNGVLSNRTDVFSTTTDVAYAQFLVDGIDGGEYSICYHWSNARTVDYSDIAVTFYSFSGFSIQGGSASDFLVEGTEKVMNVLGSGVGEGDEIRLIVPQNSNDPICTEQPGQGDAACDSPFDGKTFVVDGNSQV